MDDLSPKVRLLLEVRPQYPPPLRCDGPCREWSEWEVVPGAVYLTRWCLNCGQMQIGRAVHGR